MNTTRFIFLLTLLLCLNTSAKERSIYDYSYEELAQLSITSTSFFEMSIAESPGYVQVFDLTKLELGAHYSLSNIIEQHAVGSSIGSHARHGALHGVRGILIDNSAKTLLMVNGQQINPRSHFGASLSLNSPFLGDIQKVEVINGPGAIIHGSGAINGFINLIPKNGQENKGGVTSLTYGFKGQLAKFESGYGLSFSPEHNLYVYAGVIDAKGFEANEGYGLNKADYSSYETKAWTNDNFRISTFWKYQSFNLQAIYQELNASTHNALEPNPAHSTYLALQPRLTINLGSSEDLEIVNSLFWHEHAFVFNDLTQGGREWHWENKLIFRTTRLTNHSLALGGLYGIKQFDKEKQFFRNKLKGGAEAADTNWQEYSFFMEDIWRATEKFNISLGLRYDKYMLEEIHTNGISFSPEDGDQLSPRLAFHYQINNSHNIKLSYQHGFRMPEAAYYNWFTINNNAAQALGFASATLEPETMDSYEFNYQWNSTPRLTLGLNLYYNEFEDQLSWGPLQNIWTDAEVLAINAFNGVTWGGGQFQNINDSSQAYGGELIADAKLSDNITSKLSYAYVKVAGIEVQRYPAHQIKLNLTAHFLNNKLALGFNYLFNSAFSLNAASDSGGIYDDQRHLFNFFSNYQINESLNVRLNVENVFRNDTPRVNFNSGNFNKGNLGSGERLVYLSVNYHF